jgi:hypothetical protein
MPSSLMIKFIFSEIQVVGRLNSPNKMLHRVLCHVLRDISFIRTLWSAFQCNTELGIKDIREILAGVFFN